MCIMYKIYPEETLFRRVVPTVPITNIGLAEKQIFAKISLFFILRLATVLLPV